MFKSQNKKLLVNFTPHSKKEKENFLSAANYKSPGWAIIVRWYNGQCELCELQQQTAPGAVAPDIPANSQGQRLERCLQPLMHSGRPAVWRPGIQRLQIQCTPHLSIVKTEVPP